MRFQAGAGIAGSVLAACGRCVSLPCAPGAQALCAVSSLGPALICSLEECSSIREATRPLQSTLWVWARDGGVECRCQWESDCHLRRRVLR